MEQTIDNTYYALFEQMVSSMTNPEEFNRERLIVILSEIARSLHLTKVVTEFYRNVRDEREGNGEVLCDYDEGVEDEVVVFEKRFVTKTAAVVKGSAYAAKEDAGKLTEEELHRIDAVMRAIFSFVSRNRLQTAVERFAFHDENDYPNTRAFIRFAEQIAAKGKLSEYAVICLNLKHFSLINQDIGRSMGDVVMRNYVMLLSIAAGANTIVTRMGGDNFLMLCKKDLLSDVLDILKGVPVTYDDAGDKRVTVSASAGVFIIPEDFTIERGGDLIDRTYSAQQIAKLDASGSVVYYDDSMQSMRKKSLRTRQLFFEGMEKGEIHAFYQPKVDVLTGKIVGAEALCRWIRDGKIVSPGEFIPVLEQNMDICKLDFFMLDLVCQDIRRWMDEGRRVVRVSVNLSRKHLVDADLLTHIMKIIEKNDVPHEYIEIELTETTTDVGFRDLSRVVGGLHLQGICTSVDDFGMGYSSLNLIREIPWNVLKIDRCFLPTDEESADSVTSLMFKHVVSMARDLGLECITEGVETIRQVDILRENNCHIAQGFYFDRPLPVEEFEKKIDHSYGELLPAADGVI